MCKPISDQELEASQTAYLCFLSNYDLDSMDPLAALIREVLVSGSGDVRRAVYDFVQINQVCTECEGEGYILAADTEDEIDTCTKCAGIGALQIVSK